MSAGSNFNMTSGKVPEDERAERFDAHWEQFEAHWDKRLDELITGVCSEEQFIAEVETLHADPLESPWSVVALMDQRVRRGQLPAATFRAVGALISRRELNLPDAEPEPEASGVALSVAHPFGEYSGDGSELMPDMGEAPLFESDPTLHEALRFMSRPAEAASADGAGFAAFRGDAPLRDPDTSLPETLPFMERPADESGANEPQFAAYPEDAPWLDPDPAPHGAPESPAQPDDEFAPHEPEVTRALNELPVPDAYPLSAPAPAVMAVPASVSAVVEPGLTVEQDYLLPPEASPAPPEAEPFTQAADELPEDEPQPANAGAAPLSVSAQALSHVTRFLTRPAVAPVADFARPPREVPRPEADSPPPDPHRFVTQPIVELTAAEWQAAPPGELTARPAQDALPLRVRRVITQPMHASGVPEPTSQRPAPTGNAAPAETALQPQEALTAGAVLRDRYEIKGVVGHGGMGTVYQAVDNFRRDRGQSPSFVAIKVLHERTQGYPEALARLRREFYSTQSLAHSNIVKVFDIDREGAVDFFTMEYLDGEPLSKVLGRFGHQRLPREAAWSFIRQLADALAHAHERRVVHADLKPQNVMLLKSGEVRVLDFGASLAGSRGQFTPAYASCELLAGQAPDARDDLFALACLSYELLAGTHPYGEKRASEARAMKLKPKRPPGLTSRQWRVLEQGLAFDRENRSMSVRDWFNALGAAPETWEGIPSPDLVAAAAPPGQAATPSAKRRVRAVAIVASVALIALLAGLYRRQIPARPASVAAVTATPEKKQAVSVAPAAMPAASPADTAPAAAVNAPPAPVAAPRLAPLRQAAPPDLLAGSKDAATQSGTSATPSPVRSRSRAASPPTLQTPRRTVRAAGGTISLSARGYQVRSLSKFVELKVARSDATAPASVSWWTEDGSARAGVDYIAQPKTTAFFAAGSRVTTLFVKTAGHERRRQAVNFSVRIANPSSGALDNSRTRVTLLPAAR